MEVNSNVIKNEFLCAQKELINFTRTLKKQTLIKSLAAIAAIVVGVALILFLSANYTSIGIGMILIATLCVYQYSKHYQNVKKIFTRAAEALPCKQSLSLPQSSEL